MSASSAIGSGLTDGHTLGGRQTGAEADSRPRTRLLAGLCVVGLLASTVEIVLDASDGSSPLVPLSPDLSGWLSRLGEPLGYRIFLIALLVFTASYAILMVLCRRLPTRLVIGLVLALQIIVSAGPILLSTDVFSYLAYARMALLHGVNPYVHGPFAIHLDAIYEFVGSDWRRSPTAYGPLFTLISYPIALLGVAGSVWGMKVLALLSSLGTLGLTWHCAGRRGLDRRLAVAIVGCNPLWVIYGLGGAHNDLLMTLFMMGAVALALSGREAPAAASVVAGALIKATVGVMLPFMFLGSDLRQLGAARGPRRLAVLLGTLASVLVGAAIGYAVFGRHGIDLIAALNRDAALVSTDGFPDQVAHLLGKPGVFPVDHRILKVLLVVIILYLLWRTWRGFDWVAASGWAMLAIVVTSTWLLPWYILWSLPLAVVTRERRLLFATLAVQALFIVHQLGPMFSTHVATHVV